MFSNNSYMKVWDVSASKSGKYYVVEMSSNRKNQDGEYVRDFSSKFVRFVGKAKEKINSIEKGSVIQIKSCGVENSYNKEEKKEYTTYLVFDFDLANTDRNQASNKGTKPKSKKSVDTDYDYDDDLPF